MSESIQSTLISALPAATKVSDTDIVVLENGSTTQKITIAQLKEALGINALNTKILNSTVPVSQIGLTAICIHGIRHILNVADGTGIKFATWKSYYPNYIKSMHKYVGNCNNSFADYIQVTSTIEVMGY